MNNMQMMCEIICKLASVIFESARQAYFLKDRRGTQCQMNGKATLKGTATGAGRAALAPEGPWALGTELLSGV